MRNRIFRFVCPNPACQIELWSDDYDLDAVTPAALGQIQMTAIQHAGEMQLRPGQQLITCYLKYGEERNGSVYISWINEVREVDDGEIGGITLPTEALPTPVRMENPPRRTENIWGQAHVVSIVSSSLLDNGVPRIYLKTEFVHSLHLMLASLEKTYRALLREMNLRTENNSEFDPYEAAIARMTEVRNSVVDKATSSPGGTGDSEGSETE